jgi:hypothetical protein
MGVYHSEFIMGDVRMVMLGERCLDQVSSTAAASDATVLTTENSY